MKISLTVQEIELIARLLRMIEPKIPETEPERLTVGRLAGKLERYK